MINPALSTQLRLMSFCAMCSVVLIHSKIVPFVNHPNDSVIWMQNLICSTWTEWAVPFFFAVSGFFYAHTKQFSYFPFLLKKAKTLLVPYVCWSIMGALVQLLTAIPNNLRMEYDLFENTIFRFSSPQEIMNALFGCVIYPNIGNGLVGPYGDRPLWYVRALVIIFLFSPVFNWLRKTRIISIILAFCLIFLFSNFMIPYLYIKCGTIGFFLLGILIYEHQNKINIPDTVLIACGVCAILLAFVFARYDCLLKYGERIFPFLVSGGFWYLFRRWRDAIPDYTFIKYTFWVYCIHMLFCETLIWLGVVILGNNTISSIVLLFIMPFIILSISLSLAVVTKKTFPRLFCILSGGRG